ncbi:hypothetical protein LYSHEL_24110 [Lysobacter helvus]|uniref:Copper resistance protein NlpE n=2 Tax=Lysobacteraceae TaxID=32033 RepID=A0ABN6FUK3_9GAMM|nr:MULTISPECIES: hypothetical protein [Lysobacter]BCT93387.1 hypothetical protein LYSCAS_24110 [Lysobacter caseinilyticus]BCT96540.1 hypothetical protein LYSHEL_24110 [Lysobacter helvus]
MRKSLPFALLALATLAACNRAPSTDATPAAATVAAPATVAEVAPAAPATTAHYGVAESAAPGEHTTFDAKAFAGSFGNANMSVTFTADGMYNMTNESLAAKEPATGTWTLEPDAHHVRLDPNSKADADRVYELVSNDELRNGDEVLKRSTAQ